MGEGTGGGGAVIALLVLWVVSAAFVLTTGGLGTPIGASGKGVVMQPLSPAGSVTAMGPSADNVLDCEAAGSCDAPISRADLAVALSATFPLPATGDDFFTDDEGAAHEDAINRLAAAGVTGGCGSGSYCPDAIVTRAALATMLARILELPDATKDFFDDDDGSPHEAAINAITTQDITDGCGPRAYCPSSPVTRGHLAVFLQRSLAIAQPAS